MIGGVIGVGPSFVANYGIEDFVDGTFLGAVRACVLFGHFELSVELAPVLWFPSFDYGQSTLSVSATVGGYIPLTSRLVWPMRFRFGLSAVNTPNDDVMAVVGFELIGLGYRLDSGWMVDVSLPSFRYVGEFDRFSVFTWPITLAVSRIL